MKKVLRNDSGITLIMLVLTIIVLGIITWIAIDAIVDDGGVIDKAEEQKVKVESEQKYLTDELAEYKDVLSGEDNTKLYVPGKTGDRTVYLNSQNHFYIFTYSGNNGGYGGFVADLTKVKKVHVKQITDGITGSKVSIQQLDGGNTGSFNQLENEYEINTLSYISIDVSNMSGPCYLALYKTTSFPDNRLLEAEVYFEY